MRTTLTDTHVDRLNFLVGIFLLELLFLWYFIFFRIDFGFYTYYIVIYFGIILASFILWWKFLKVFYDWVFQIISQRFTLSNYEICLLKPINAQNILQKYFEVVLIYLTFTIWFVSVKKLEEERKRLELLIEEHQSYNGKK